MAKRRTAAQKRATAKMIAANRRRARAGRAPSKSTRKAPARRRSNPTPVARKRRAYSAARNLSNPTRRRRVRRRSNPMTTRVMDDMVMPSVTGAAGAILVDVVLGFVPLPAILQSNAYMRAGVKGLAAIGLAMVADQTKLVTKRTATQLGVGSLTVTMATLGRDLVGQVAPNVQLDGLGYYTSAMPAGTPQPMDSLGLYVEGGSQGQLPSSSRTVGSMPSGGLGMYDEMTEQGYAY